jgi:hypothetical protein
MALESTDSHIVFFVISTAYLNKFPRIRVAMYPLESRQNKEKRKVVAERANQAHQSLKNERLVRRIRESEPVYFFILTAKGERILREFESKTKKNSSEKDHKEQDPEAGRGSLFVN